MNEDGNHRIGVGPSLGPLQRDIIMIRSFPVTSADILIICYEQ